MIAKMSQTRELDRRGMTLVELMITMSIFAVVLGVVMGFMTTTGRSYNATRDRVHYQQSMRSVLSLMTREIRSTGCDPNGVGFDHFSLADNDALLCQMDLNGDSDTSDIGPDESVSYVFNSATGELTRDPGGTGGIVIMRGLTAVQFTYLDANGAPLTAVPLSALDRFQIRYVDLDLAGETNNGEPVNYATRIALRND